MTVSEFINKVGFKVNKSDVQAVNNTIKDIKSTAVKLLGVIGIGFSLSQLRQISEEFNGINDSINYTYKALGDTKEAQNKILEAANATKTSYGTMADVVTKLTQLNEDMFPIDDATTFATVVQQLMITSGKSESEAAAAQNLLARAFQREIVDAGTLNQIQRQAPALYKEIANSIGVSSEQLQAMAKNGQLTAQTVKDAVISSKNAAQLAFNELDYSISDAMTNIRNQWGFFVDDFNSTFGITQKIAKGMVSGFTKVMNVFKQAKDKLVTFADKVGGVDNLLKILAITAGALVIAFNFDKIASGIKLISTLLHGLSLKAAVIIGVIVLIALLVDDFINFMQGNNSLLGEFLKKAGIDCDEVRNRFKEFWGELKKVIDHVKELGKQLGGKLAASLASLLTNVMTKIVELLPKIIALLDPIIELVETLFDALFGILDAVLPALVEIIGVVAEILLDAATTILPVIIDLINQILPVLKDFAQQIMPIIVDTIKRLAPVIQEVITIAAKLISTVLPPIIKAISRILPLLVRIIEALLPALINIIEAILPPIEKIIDALGPLISTILDVVIDLVEVLVNNLLPPLVDIINLLAPLIGDIVSLVAELISAVLPIVVELIKLIAPILKTIIETLGPILQIIAKVLGTVVKAVSKIIAVIKPIIKVVSTVITTIVKAFSKVTQGFSKVFSFVSNLFSGVVDFFAGIFNNVVGAISNAFSSIGSFFSGIWDTIKAPFGAVVEWFSGIFSDAWDAIQSVFSSVGDFFSGIWEGIKGAFGAVADWFGGIFTDAWTAVKNVFCTGGEIFMGIVDGILDGFKAVVNAIIDGINAVIAVPFDGINWALNKIKNISILGVEPFKWIKTIDTPQIPHLAQGGYVEPNKPQTVVVGDNRHEGEIVSPISKMQEAVVSALRMFMPQIQSVFGGLKAFTGWGNSSSRSVTQNVEINNTFNGDKAIQQKAAATMDRSARDVTSQLARGLAYAK